MQKHVCVQLYKHQGWEQLPVLFYFKKKRKKKEMKKIVLVSLAFLFVLVGCGQKKKKLDQLQKQKRIRFSRHCQLLKMLRRIQLRPRLWSCPESDDGSQQTQTITYKDKTFLSLTIQQNVQSLMS